MASAEDIIIAGIARSGKMKNQQIATASEELLKKLNRGTRTLFAAAARINPYYFGKELDVAFVTDGWAWPADMNLLFGLELPSGAECVIVPRDQKAAETGKPAVFALGPKLYTAGNTLDPVAGNLTFFYSRGPALPAELDDDIDAGLPEDYHEPLINEIAAYLATKDGRYDDRSAFMEEYTAGVGLFMAHIEHATATIERRKYGQVRRFNLQTLLPTGAQVTGGVAG